jgi:hypothetical protein
MLDTHFTKHTFTKNKTSNEKSDDDYKETNWEKMGTRKRINSSAA